MFDVHFDSFNKDTAINPTPPLHHPTTVSMQSRYEKNAAESEYKEKLLGLTASPGHIVKHVPVI